jgi:hypothetical protein
VKAEPIDASWAARLFRGCLAIVVIVGAVQRAYAVPSVARQWDQQMIDAVLADFAKPSVHPRNFYHLSAAMYDAWAAYDPTAGQLFHQEKLAAGDIEAARREAISHAAYNIIRHRFVFPPGGAGPGAFSTLVAIEQQMVDLGYDSSNTSTVGNSPAALGNRIAQTVINAGLADGSNELGGFADTSGYTPSNPLLDWALPGTNASNPNLWQPLHFANVPTDKLGRPIGEQDQRFSTPHWYLVQPFALKPSDRSANGVYHDQGEPPRLNGPGDAAYRDEVQQLIRLSSKLDPNLPEMIDISPASLGNRPLGSQADVGYAVNPITGLPYTQQIVKHGDYGRALTEWFSDPGRQWNEIGNHVTDRMEAVGVDKRIGGSGPVVSDLEWDVKLYLAVNGAVHDAGIAAWNHKRYYDSARPITMIRYMGQLGQSSDPGLTVDLGGGNIVNTYHPDGLRLEPGLVEVITPATTAPGERHAHLAGNEGKVAIFAYRGPMDVGPDDPPYDDASEIGGVGWILPGEWVPYQLIGFVTPPFPGFVSGHSTFARSAAEVLTELTGSSFFPGGLGEIDLSQGSTFLNEYGPSADITLQWATYFDASDASGFARLYGGIHPAADDLGGRNIGHLTGLGTWVRARRLFHGVPEPSSGVLLVLGAMGLVGRRDRRGRPGIRRCLPLETLARQGRELFAWG